MHFFSVLSSLYLHCQFFLHMSLWGSNSRVYIGHIYVSLVNFNLERVLNVAKNRWAFNIWRWKTSMLGRILFVEQYDPSFSRKKNTIYSLRWNPSREIVYVHSNKNMFPKFHWKYFPSMLQSGPFIIVNILYVPWPKVVCARKKIPLES